MNLPIAGPPFRHKACRRICAWHILLQLIAIQFCGAALVIIDDFSPRIVYNTPVLPESTCKFQQGGSACDRHWWYEHGDSRGADLNDTVHTTWGPGTVASLEFRGPSVSLYGIQLVRFGAQAIVTLDNEPFERVDSNITELPNGASLRTQQLLYSKTGLDPSSSHKISVAYDDSTFNPSSRAWFSIDYFVVDESPQSSGSVATSRAPPSSPPSQTTSNTLTQELQGAPSLTTATNSATPTGSPAPFQDRPIASPERSAVPSPPSTATKSHNVNVGLIVGAVLGGVAGGLLVALLAVSTWRRRRDRALRRGSSRQLISPLLDMAATTPTLETSSARFFPQVTSYAPSSVSDSIAEQQSRQLALASMPPPYTPSSSLVIAPAERRSKG